MIKYTNFDEEESLVKYYKDVKKTVLLTPDEEVGLAIKIQAGDTKAIDTLLKQTLSLSYQSRRIIKTKGYH
jgi:DNA-directed RNA polymerase sigma subunit (sigma70/sigma32)